jgi:hypothetical protein
MLLLFSACSDGGGSRHGPMSVDEVDDYLAQAKGGDSLNNPVQLSVKAETGSLYIVSNSINKAKKYVVLDLSQSTEIVNFGEFDHCSYLVQIILPETVTYISDHAFDYCGMLTQIILPETVTYIGDFAFSKCFLFRQITLPASIAYIGDRAFYRCDQLTLVTCHAVNPPELGRDVFEDTDTSLVIKVPAGSVTAYKTAWSEWADKIAAL